MTQVTPTSSMMLASSIWVSSRSFLSSAPSGSSRRSSCGFLARLRARATRCCWPPESWCGFLFAYALELHELQHRFHAGLHFGLGQAVAAQAEGDVVEHREVRKERVALEHHVHRPLVGRQLGQVAAVERDRSGGRRLEAGEHAQQRRLAAAGGAEQGEHLALGDVDRDVVDGTVAVEVLDDVRDAKESVVGHALGRRKRAILQQRPQRGRPLPPGGRGWGGSSPVARADVLNRLRRFQDIRDRADRLVDVRLLDDQRRRQGDDVAGGADQHAALEALAEDVEGALARRCRGSTRARCRRPGRCCGCRSRSATRAASAARARRPAPSWRRASAGPRRRRSRACRAPPRRRAGAPSRCSRAGTRPCARGRS